MRYSVNFYREREARAAHRRRRITWSGVAALVAGIEVFLIGFLFVSGFLVRDRARQLEGRLARIAASEPSLPDDARTELARAVLQARVQRVDWAPMLESVAGALPGTLILDKIEADTGERGKLNGLDLEGHVTGGSTDLSAVFRFMEALRDSAAITRFAPHIDLGTAQISTQTQQGFRVLCRIKKEEASP